MFLVQHFPQNWPILFICLAMLASAVIDWWKFKVPNLLTMPVIVLGWLYGFLHWPLGLHLGEAGVGGIGAALAGTLIGSLLLLAYMIGGMGAGDVKMCMGFGAWIGAFYGVEPPAGDAVNPVLGNLEGQALWIILYAQFAGILVGGVIGMVMILLRMEFRQNVQHARAIVMDAVTTGSIAKMHERANERRPRWHRLPYGVPMCIGFLGYLLWVQPAAPAEEQAEKPAATTPKPPAAAQEEGARLATASCLACAADPAPSRQRPACRGYRIGTTDSFVTGRKRVEVATGERPKLTSERSGAVLLQVIQSQGSGDLPVGAVGASGG
ncbi:hypothetical protein AYO40_02415 [Planctomycetaceae bacterium SCGC AG-212-D15]|nr:hypothetical protein AYO40_02415 [Planctomycetaceae bacterium SCGC AG-212-D15]